MHAIPGWFDYSETGSALNTIFGDRSSSKHCTTLTSAAFAFLITILSSPSCVSVSPFVKQRNKWSLVLFVLTRTACMLPMTFSAAIANGKSTPSTSSGEIQLFTAPRPASWAASRSRTRMRAANKSPVPEKKQSMAGTSILNRRGRYSEETVEPMMEMVSGDEGRRIDVMMMCGMWWVL